MKRRPSSAPSPLRFAAHGAFLAATVCAGCAGGPAAGSPAPALSEAEWRALAAPRPAALLGAVRLSVTQIELLGAPAWPPASPVAADLGLTELVVAGLLRRADVQLVERRRFAAAVEAERSGRERPAGAPAAGVSPGVELTASISWVPLAGETATLEVRLVDAETGRVVRTVRSVVPGRAEAVGLARAVVGAIVAALAEVGRLPSWQDPVAAAAPNEYADSAVSASALADFLSGLAAEERWRWDTARVSYQAAARSGGFFEAEAALARAARLRLGGTLGEG